MLGMVGHDSAWLFVHARLYNYILAVPRLQSGVIDSIATVFLFGSENHSCAVL